MIIRLKVQDILLKSRIVLIVGVLAMLDSCADNPVNEQNKDASTAGGEQTFNVAPSDQQKYEEIKQHLIDKDYAVAEAKLQAIIAKYPGHSGTLANLGLVYSETGRIDLAEKTLMKALSMDKKNPQVYLRLALVYKRQGKLVKALETYRNAIEIDADNAKAHYNIAILYDLYMQDRSSAILHLKKYQALTNEKDNETATWIKQLERDNLTNQTAEKLP